MPIARSRVTWKTLSSALGNTCGSTLFVNEATPTGTPGSDPRSRAAATLARSSRDGAPRPGRASMEREMSMTISTSASERTRRSVVRSTSGWVAARPSNPATPSTATTGTRRSRVGSSGSSRTCRTRAARLEIRKSAARGTRTTRAISPPGGVRNSSVTGDLVTAPGGTGRSAFGGIGATRGIGCCASPQAQARAALSQRKLEVELGVAVVRIQRDCLLQVRHGRLQGRCLVLGIRNGCGEEEDAEEGHRARASPGIVAARDDGLESRLCLRALEQDLRVGGPACPRASRVEAPGRPGGKRRSSSMPRPFRVRASGTVRPDSTGCRRREPPGSGRRRRAAHPSSARHRPQEGREGGQRKADEGSRRRVRLASLRVSFANRGRPRRPAKCSWAASSARRGHRGGGTRPEAASGSWSTPAVEFAARTARSERSCRAAPRRPCGRPPAARAGRPER